jgi:tetratricopeptide (TPR) repeat protein
MGRFSQLETGGLDGSAEPADADSGLSLREKRARESEDASAPLYDAAYYLAEADRLLYSGQFDKALRKFSLAAQQSQIAVEAWVGQVLCHCLLGRTTEAQNWSRRALELFPEDARLISLQGLAYAVGGTVQRGLACSDFALSKTGTDSLTFLVRGMILELAENPNSRACFDKAIELRTGNDWRIPLLIGMILMNVRRHGKALEFLEMAARESPGNDLAWERLGEVCGRLGMGARAAEAYRTALQINPSNQAAGHGMAAITNSSMIARLMRRLFKR